MSTATPDLLILNLSAHSNVTLIYREALNLTQPNYAVWKFTMVFDAIISTLLFLCNGTVLSFYIFVKQLHTSFATYIIMLLSTNIIYGISKNVLDIINGLYKFWWTGSRSCDFYLYSNWVLSALPMHAHILIASNRLWAMWGPISYRHYHKERLAIYLCLGMIVYVHVMCLPGYVLDAVHYRLPIMENGCNLNTLTGLKVWSAVVIVCIYDFPIIFIITSCCLIVYKGKKLRRVRSGKEANRPNSTKNGKISGSFSNYLYLLSKLFVKKTKKKPHIK